MRFLIGIIVAVLALAGGAVAFAVSSRAIDPIEPPAADVFDPALVAKGERLALIGNCQDCHSVEGGEPYAGGTPIKTPFGTIHGTNITPDPETGIGRWSEEAFRRAMYRGVDREGRHLYPAFPYTHFTKMTQEDVAALYAFLMTRQPVHRRAPKNDLPVPLNLRPTLAGWKLLFLDEGRFEPEPARSAEINRGAYLTQAVAHCGACHTPRNFLQAEKRDQRLTGGQSGDWHAPGIAADAPAPMPWTVDAMTRYLRDQWAEHHGVALGPMQEVARNLARVPEEDVRAIAAYVASLSGEPDTGRRTGAEILAKADATGQIPAQPGVVPAAQADVTDIGASIYTGACAQCHESETPSRLAEGLKLAYSTSLRAPDPRNLIHIIGQGVHPPDGEPGHFMPGFEGALTAEQVTALAGFLRDRFAGLPAWPDLDSAVRERWNGDAGRRNDETS